MNNLAIEARRLESWQCRHCRWMGGRDSAAIHPRQGYIVCPACWHRGYEGDLYRRTTVVSVRGRRRADLEADPAFVYVGRRCAGWDASIWGNPFKPGKRGGVEVDFRRVDPRWWECVEDRRDLVRLFRAWLASQGVLSARLPELRGKALGCWCGDWKPGEPDIGCHAVVLARLADDATGDANP